jgi:hypothetical protein
VKNTILITIGWLSSLYLITAIASTYMNVPGWLIVALGLVVGGISIHAWGRTKKDHHQ